MIGPILLFFSCMFSPLFSLAVTLPPKVSITVPQEAAVEGRSVPLTITIIRDPAAAIDTNSFQLDGQPLSVESIGEEKVLPEEGVGLVVSKFLAQLPERSAGVYTVGPVSVKVGDLLFRSPSITLTVQSAESSPKFKLEAKISGPSKLFVGQEVTFEYQLSSPGPMKLVREELPLLHTPGCLPLGGPEVTTEQFGGLTVQYIRQRARAVDVGKQEGTLSIVEGVEVDESGKQIGPIYRAEAQPKTFEIVPLPEQGRPAYFDGAFGSFTWRVTPLDGTTTKVGAPFHVEYFVTGRGELGTVQFPSLDRLSGLQETFWTDLSPPVGEEIDGTKRFILVVRPKRPGVFTIPGFVTASFDPISERYLTSSAAPLSVTVLEGEGEVSEERATAKGLFSPFDLTAPLPPPIPLWLPLLLLGVAVPLTFGEWLFARAVVSRRARQPTSRDLFYQAVKRRSHGDEGLLLLRKGFLVRLYEVGLTERVESSFEPLSLEGITGEVRLLLQTIDRRLYSAEGPTIQEIYDEALPLSYRLRQIPSIERGEP